ncbi:hypothetical protein GOBAR_DD09303 [Gossypium barbadense]|nr:hypothetical protein GOBAR_DD09303 [Gossypium barbadense]
MAMWLYEKGDWLAEGVLKYMDLRQVDVNNTFLNRNLTEEVYMQQPPSYVQTDANEQQLVCRLNKASSKDRVGTVLQLQVLSLALLFLLYSALGILNNKKGSYFWPDPVLELLLLLAFVEEFLLYYLQRNDTSGIENRYFDLLCVPIAICVVSTMLELRSNRSIYSKSVRGIGLILHGTCLHEKSRGNYTIKCRSHPDYHRARSIATLQFNCHLALLVVLVVGMLSLIGKRNGVAVGASGDGLRYKPLGAEIQLIDSNGGNFTLDSDDDLDSGIKEEDDLVK